MSSTEISRYNFVNAWPRALRLALIILLFLFAIVGGMAVAGRTATRPSRHPDPEPEPDPDPKFDGPDDLAPNPGPEPTPPDDLARTRIPILLAPTTPPPRPSPAP